MKNLIEQASQWLQSEDCRLGDIIKRTQFVIAAFRSYVNQEQDEIIENTGLTASSIKQRIDDTDKSIRRILSAFLRGNQLDALGLTREMMKTMKMDKMQPGSPMYKCRENGCLFPFLQEQMFHIPFESRDLVGNQRYSLSGLPCLYLGGSSYICWEELGRRDFNTSNFCGYSLREEVNVFDMLLPASITSEHQIRCAVLTLACSLAAKRDSLFKPEYILPQCVLHSLIFRSYYNHMLFCVRYYSSHLLNGDADFFPPDYTNSNYLQKYVNYVFPATSSRCVGYHEGLRSLFNQTSTITLMRETLLHPERILSGYKSDTYLKSQFGLMDAILDKELGLIPKREEGGMGVFRESQL